MKVIRVRAKVVSPKMYTQEDMDAMGAELASCRSQIMGLKQKNAQLEADARNWKARADSAAKAKSEDETLYLKATNDLAARLVKAMDDAEAARAEAADLNLELMERQCRIDELERRIEWLQAHSDTGADFVS